MKKKLLLVLSTAVAAAGIAASVSAEDAAVDASAINLVVSGNAIECDQAPVIVEGRTLIPLRAVAESVGAEIEWLPETKTVHIGNALFDAKLIIGSNELEITNNLTNTTETKEIDVPAQIMNGRTMVPVRVIAENFGLDVDWDQDTRTVSITVPGAEEAVEETTEEATEETTEEALVEETTADTEETTVDADDDDDADADDTELEADKADEEETEEAEDSDDADDAEDAEETTEAE